MQKPFYQNDLSLIHDQDHGALSQAAYLVIQELSLLPGNVVVDLGCGSGILLELLDRKGLELYGADISESMIHLAKKRVSQAQLELQSLYEYSIPKAHLITAIGECFNYLAARDSQRNSLLSVFEKIYHALVPQGYFLFDIAEHGLGGPQGQYARIVDKADYTLFLKVTEQRETGLLSRDIWVFRKEGSRYRRLKETHWLQLYSGQEIEKQLTQIGFKVAVLDHYGSLKLRDKHIAFLAQKM